MYTLKAKLKLMGDVNEMALAGFCQSLIVHRRNKIGYGLQCADLMATSICILIHWKFSYIRSRAQI